MESLVTPSFWQDRPVFITGGTGLVGSWLVKKLAQVQANAVCLIRDWVPQSELVRSGIIDQVKVVRGDVRDRDLLERILGEYEIDTVIHLAAQTIVTIANRNPISTFETNIAGTWNLLEACRRSPKIKQIVVASSDKAYGEQTDLPYTENTPLQGKHPYDVSKSAADLISHTYANCYDLPVVITRCGNFYGGGDLNWNRIVPGTIRSLLRGQQPIIRSDGAFVRDYFFVEDGVEAYMMLAEKLVSTPDLRGEAFNFSNDAQTSVKEIVAKIIRLIGIAIEPDIRNEATHEIRHQYLNSEKARTTLGWRPLYTLEEGLSKTIDWYRKFLEI